MKKQIVARLALATAVCFTTSTALAAKPPKPTSPAYKVTALEKSHGMVHAINNWGLVGTTLPPFRDLYLFVPKDTNGDGLPDIWFEDANGDGANDLAVAIGLPVSCADKTRIVNAQVRGLNSLGQALIVISYTNDTGRGVVGSFVLTPQDINGDGSLEWFQAAANGGNVLMRQGSAWMNPCDINDSGYVAGSEFIGYYVNPPVCLGGFVISPIDLDGDGKRETYFMDSNSDGVNDLEIDLGHAKGSDGTVILPQPVQISQTGQVAGNLLAQVNGTFPSRGSFIVIPKRVPETGELVWNEDSNGDGANDLIKVLPGLMPGWETQVSVLDQNPSGTGIVGDAYIPDSFGQALSRPVLWRVDAEGKVTITDLGDFGGSWSRYSGHATTVNDKLQVLGSFSYESRGLGLQGRNFLWQNGVIQDLHTVLGVNESSGCCIDNSGRIVGSYSDPTVLSPIPFVAVPIQ